MTRLIRRLPLGTRSLLFGAHQALLHPWFVARAWWLLYGFPFDPRLWAAFFLHDIGYWGAADLDGEEGERHPELGARLMKALFGAPWGDLCLYHSRHYARRDGVTPSPLCAADKLAISLTPAFLYLPLVRFTGEIEEYRGSTAQKEKSLEPTSRALDAACDESWYRSVQQEMRRWALRHARRELRPCPQARCIRSV